MRSRRRSLAALFLAAAPVIFVWSGCGQESDTTTTTPGSRATPRRPRAAQGDTQESVDLASLLRDVPEYGGSGRNLFAFGRAPVVEPPPRRDTPPPPPTPPPTRRPETPVAAAPRIDLKFAGLVETKTLGGAIKKYAVLLDGTEILTGAEGDLVANRYRIVQIGLESVTVGVAGSNDTQLIPLQSN